MKGRHLLLFVASLLAMIGAILIGLYALLKFFASAGTRSEGIVPLVVALALVALALRGLAAARGAAAREPVRTSRKAGRAMLVSSVFALALVAIVGWQAFDYRQGCEDLRAKLRSESLNETPKSSPELPVSWRACTVPSGSSPELVEHRSGKSVALRAQIWRWLFWDAQTSSRGPYIVVDDGSAVRFLFRR